MLTSDQSQLYAQRIKLADPESYVVLPEVISKEPLGPVVRQGDEEWFDIVRWTLFAMLNAEEAGITSKNVEQEAVQEESDVRRLLGAEGEMGRTQAAEGLWADRQAGRQLRRSLRSQRRRRKRTEDRARYQRVRDQGRPCSNAPPVR